MDIKISDEIIVYLDHNSKIDTKGYSDLWLDFRTLEDWQHFRRVMDVGDQNVEKRATYFHISNYQTQKRLQTGCYYKLNTDLLSSASIERVEDSLVYFADFDFSRVGDKSNRELLESHSPLEPIKNEGI